MTTANAAVPLIFELGCELTYPVGEGTTNGVLTTINNLGGLVFLLVLMIPNIRTYYNHQQPQWAGLPARVDDTKHTYVLQPSTTSVGWSSCSCWWYQTYVRITTINNLSGLVFLLVLMIPNIRTYYNHQQPRGAGLPARVDDTKHTYVLQPSTTSVGWSSFSSWWYQTYVRITTINNLSGLVFLLVLMIPNIRTYYNHQQPWGAGLPTRVDDTKHTYVLQPSTTLGGWSSYSCWWYQTYVRITTINNLGGLVFLLVLMIPNIRTYYNHQQPQWAGLPARVDDTKHTYVLQPSTTSVGWSSCSCWYQTYVRITTINNLSELVFLLVLMIPNIRTYYNHQQPQWAGLPARVDDTKHTYVLQPSTTSVGWSSCSCWWYQTYVRITTINNLGGLVFLLVLIPNIRTYYNHQQPRGAGLPARVDDTKHTYVLQPSTTSGGWSSCSCWWYQTYVRITTINNLGGLVFLLVLIPNIRTYYNHQQPRGAGLPARVDDTKHTYVLQPSTTSGGWSSYSCWYQTYVRITTINNLGGLVFLLVLMIPNIRTYYNHQQPRGAGLPTRVDDTKHTYVLQPSTTSVSWSSCSWWYQTYVRITTINNLSGLVFLLVLIPNIRTYYNHQQPGGAGLPTRVDDTKHTYVLQPSTTSVGWSSYSCWYQTYVRITTINNLSGLVFLLVLMIPNIRTYYNHQQPQWAGLPTRVDDTKHTYVLQPSTTSVGWSSCSCWWYQTYVRITTINNLSGLVFLLVLMIPNIRTYYNHQQPQWAGLPARVDDTKHTYVLQPSTTSGGWSSCSCWWYQTYVRITTINNLGGLVFLLVLMIPNIRTYYNHQQPQWAGLPARVDDTKHTYVLQPSTTSGGWSSCSCWWYQTYVRITTINNLGGLVFLLVLMIPNIRTYYNHQQPQWAGLPARVDTKHTYVLQPSTTSVGWSSCSCWWYQTYVRITTINNLSGLVFLLVLIPNIRTFYNHQQPQWAGLPTPVVDTKHTYVLQPSTTSVGWSSCSCWWYQTYVRITTINNLSGLVFLLVLMIPNIRTYYNHHQPQWAGLPARVDDTKHTYVLQPSTTSVGWSSYSCWYQTYVRITTINNLSGLVFLLVLIPNIRTYYNHQQPQWAGLPARVDTKHTYVLQPSTTSVGWSSFSCWWYQTLVRITTINNLSGLVFLLVLIPNIRTYYNHQQPGGAGLPARVDDTKHTYVLQPSTTSVGWSSFSCWWYQTYVRITTINNLSGLVFLLVLMIPNPGTYYNHQQPQWAGLPTRVDTKHTYVLQPSTTSVGWSSYSCWYQTYVRITTINNLSGLVFLLLLIPNIRTYYNHQQPQWAGLPTRVDDTKHTYVLQPSSTSVGWSSYSCWYQTYVRITTINNLSGLVFLLVLMIPNIRTYYNHQQPQWAGLPTRVDDTKHTYVLQPSTTSVGWSSCSCWWYQTYVRITTINNLGGLVFLLVLMIPNIHTYYNHQQPQWAGLPTRVDDTKHTYVLQPSTTLGGWSSCSCWWYQTYVRITTINNLSGLVFLLVLMIPNIRTYYNHQQPWGTGLPARVDDTKHTYVLQPSTTSVGWSSCSSWWYQTYVRITTINNLGGLVFLLVLMIPNIRTYYNHQQPQWAGLPARLDDTKHTYVLQPSTTSMGWSSCSCWYQTYVLTTTINNLSELVFLLVLIPNIRTYYNHQQPQWAGLPARVDDTKHTYVLQPSTTSVGWSSCSCWYQAYVRITTINNLSGLVFLLVLMIPNIRTYYNHQQPQWAGLPARVDDTKHTYVLQPSTTSVGWSSCSCWWYQTYVRITTINNLGGLVFLLVLMIPNIRTYYNHQQPRGAGLPARVDDTKHTYVLQPSTTSVGWSSCSCWYQTYVRITTINNLSGLVFLLVLMIPNIRTYYNHQQPQWAGLPTRVDTKHTYVLQPSTTSVGWSSYSCCWYQTYVRITTINNLSGLVFLLVLIPNIRTYYNHQQPQWDGLPARVDDTKHTYVLQPSTTSVGWSSCSCWWYQTYVRITTIINLSGLVFLLVLMIPNIRTYYNHRQPQWAGLPTRVDTKHTYVLQPSTTSVGWSSCSCWYQTYVRITTINNLSGLVFLLVLIPNIRTYYNHQQPQWAGLPSRVDDTKPWYVLQPSTTSVGWSSYSCWYQTYVRITTINNLGGLVFLLVLMIPNIRTYYNHQQPQWAGLPSRVDDTKHTYVLQPSTTSVGWSSCSCWWYQTLVRITTINNLSGLVFLLVLIPNIRTYYNHQQPQWAGRPTRVDTKHTYVLQPSTTSVGWSSCSCWYQTYVRITTINNLSGLVFLLVLMIPNIRTYYNHQQPWGTGLPARVDDTKHTYVLQPSTTSVGWSSCSSWWYQTYVRITTINNLGGLVFLLVLMIPNIRTYYIHQQPQWAGLPARLDDTKHTYVLQPSTTSVGWSSCSCWYQTYVRITTINNLSELVFLLVLIPNIRTYYNHQQPQWAGLPARVDDTKHTYVLQPSTTSVGWSSCSCWYQAYVRITTINNLSGLVFLLVLMIPNIRTYYNHQQPQWAGLPARVDDTKHTYVIQPSTTSVGWSSYSCWWYQRYVRITTINNLSGLVFLLLLMIPNIRTYYNHQQPQWAGLPTRVDDTKHTYVLQPSTTSVGWSSCSCWYQTYVRITTISNLSGLVFLLVLMIPNIRTYYNHQQPQWAGLPARVDDTKHTYVIQPSTTSVGWSSCSCWWYQTYVRITTINNLSGLVFLLVMIPNIRTYYNHQQPQWAGLPSRVVDTKHTYVLQPSTTSVGWSSYSCWYQTYVRITTINNLSGLVFLLVLIPNIRTYYKHQQPQWAGLPARDDTKHTYVLQPSTTSVGWSSYSCWYQTYVRITTINNLSGLVFLLVLIPNIRTYYNHQQPQWAGLPTRVDDTKHTYVLKPSTTSVGWSSCSCWYQTYVRITTINNLGGLVFLLMLMIPNIRTYYNHQQPQWAGLPARVDTKHTYVLQPSTTSVGWSSYSCWYQTYVRITTINNLSGLVFLLVLIPNIRTYYNHQQPQWAGLPARVDDTKHTYVLQPSTTLGDWSSCSCWWYQTYVRITTINNLSGLVFLLVLMIPNIRTYYNHQQPWGTGLPARVDDTKHTYVLQPSTTSVGWSSCSSWWYQTYVRITTINNLSGLVFLLVLIPNIRTYYNHQQPQWAGLPARVDTKHTYVLQPSTTSVGWSSCSCWWYQTYVRITTINNLSGLVFLLVLIPSIRTYYNHQQPQWAGLPTRVDDTKHTYVLQPSTTSVGWSSCSCWWYQTYVRNTTINNLSGLVFLLVLMIPKIRTYYNHQQPQWAGLPTPVDDTKHTYVLQPSTTSVGWSSYSCWWYQTYVRITTINNLSGLVFMLVLIPNIRTYYNHQQPQWAGLPTRVDDTKHTYVLQPSTTSVGWSSCSCWWYQTYVRNTTINNLSGLVFLLVLMIPNIRTYYNHQQPQWAGLPARDDTKHTYVLQPSTTSVGWSSFSCCWYQTYVRITTINNLSGLVFLLVLIPNIRTYYNHQQPQWAGLPARVDTKHTYVLQASTTSVGWSSCSWWYQTYVRITTINNLSGLVFLLVLIPNIRTYYNHQQPQWAGLPARVDTKHTYVLQPSTTSVGWSSYSCWWYQTYVRIKTINNFSGLVFLLVLIPNIRTYYNHQQPWGAGLPAHVDDTKHTYVLQPSTTSVGWSSCSCWYQTYVRITTINNLSGLVFLLVLIPNIRTYYNHQQPRGAGLPARLDDTKHTYVLQPSTTSVGWSSYSCWYQTYVRITTINNLGGLVFLLVLMIPNIRTYYNHQQPGGACLPTPVDTKHTYVLQPSTTSVGWSSCSCWYQTYVRITTINNLSWLVFLLVLMIPNIRAYYNHQQPQWAGLPTRVDTKHTYVLQPSTT